MQFNKEETAGQRAEEAEAGCHAGSDGDCNWDECPQLKQYKSICPLWKESDDV